MIDIEITTYEPIHETAIASALAMVLNQPVIVAKQKPSKERALESDVEELDGLLRESLVHMHKLMCMLEGPSWVSEHEYYKDAWNFWHTLRDGMCGTSRIEGESRMCPNQAIDGSWFCDECLDRTGGEARFIARDGRFGQYPTINK
jgi:hypothetical protein